MTGFDLVGERACGVNTRREPIPCGKTGVAVAGHSSEIARLAGLNPPIQPYALQAFITGPVKRCLNTVVMSPATGTNVSQIDKGELVLGAHANLLTSGFHRVGFATCAIELAILPNRPTLVIVPGGPFGQFQSPRTTPQR